MASVWNKIIRSISQLLGSSPTTGQVPQFNGTMWVPVTLSGSAVTSVANGGGLTLTGTTLSFSGAGYDTAGAASAALAVAEAYTVSYVATAGHTGAYSDLTGKPTLGTAAARAATDFDAAGLAAAAAAASLPLAGGNFAVAGDVEFQASVQLDNGATISAGKSLQLNGSSSGSMTIKAPATPNSYTLVLPPSGGTVGQVLTVVSSAGVTTWSTPASGGNSFSSVLLAGGTSGTITIQPPAIAGTWSITLPNGQGVLGQVMVSSDGAGTMVWAYQGGIVASGEILATTITTTPATTTIATYTPTADGIFKVSGLLTVTARTSNTLYLRVVWTDQNGNSKTTNFGSNIANGWNYSGGTSAPSAVGFYLYPECEFHVQANQSITLQHQTGVVTGTITFDVSGRITQVK